MAVAELDLDDLGQRLAPLGARDLRRLAGGASSLTYTAVIDRAVRVVVKVAPPGLEPVLHRDVLRQSRLMRALRETSVAVPDILWEDPGAPPEVPPLFVMSFVEGSAAEPLFDQDAEGDSAVLAARLRNAARAMAGLHALDPAGLGLAAEPRSDIGQEITRWCRVLETVEPALVPGWEAVASTLRSRTSPSISDTVVHGDFRLGNLLATGADITAVIDWEIWSIGDPRIDAGWFLVNADPATYQRSSRHADSLPSVAELGALYAESLRRDVPDLPLFMGLACFKSAATWSLIVKHNRRRREPDPELEEMAPVLPHLLERAAELIGSG